jgi:hypothetical protein
MSCVLTLAQLPQLIGQELAVSHWISVSQTRINGFADVTDDNQWAGARRILKIDEPHATQTENYSLNTHRV